MSSEINSTTEIVTSSGPDMSMIGLISHADLVEKFVILLLFSLSVWSWAIIIDKYMLMRKLIGKTDKFEKVFWSGQLLDQLYERVKTRADHPIASVFVAAMFEWNRQSIDKMSGSLSYLSASTKERIYQAMNVARNREMEKLQKNLGFLASLGSSAPFIGLFGTVWGIMNSLQAIAQAKNATLAVVAPGISEALLTTAIGLVAAIPASIAYNYFANKINSLNSRLDDFSSELGTLLSREIDEGLK